MLSTKEEIEVWLKEMKINKYKINNDLTVDVNWSVNLSHKNLTRIPIQFGHVGGYFDCSHNLLSSLKGTPKVVIGVFNAGSNNLSSLEELPSGMIGDVKLNNNKIKSLKGLPSVIQNNLDISDNEIDCWDFLPHRIKGWLDITGNKSNYFDYKKIIVDKDIIMEYSLMPDIEELRKHCFISVGQIGGKMPPKTKNQLLFSGPFEYYRYVLEKKELLDNLNKDLKQQKNQPQQKI